MTSSAISVHHSLRAWVATADSPQVKLDASSRTVSAATRGSSNTSFGVGPPAVDPDSTA